MVMASRRPAHQGLDGPREARPRAVPEDEESTSSTRLRSSTVVAPSRFRALGCHGFTLPTMAALGGGKLGTVSCLATQHQRLRTPSARAAVTVSTRHQMHDFTHYFGLSAAAADKHRSWTSRCACVQ